VEISDDKFMADNQYFFSFRIPERFNLLIIKGDNSAQYVSLALVPNETLSRYWSVKEATPAELAGINFLEYDVIMLVGTPGIDASFVKRLKSFVMRGGALFVSYGGNTNIDYFNNAWSEVTGVSYQEPVAGTFSRAGYYTLETIDTDHPVFSVFAFEENEPPEIKFFTLPKLRLTGNAEPIMVFSGDSPALVEARFGEGKVLCFTGPMSPEYTDLPGHAFFVPFISRVAEYLASDLSALDLRLYSGESITRSLSLAGALNHPVDLITPDSAEYSITPEDVQGALVFRVKPSDQPGIYRIAYLGREIDRFAVNLHPSEGNLSTVDVEQFAAAVGADELRPLKVDETLQTAIAGFRFGRELWQLFLWLAVLLVVVEMLLARGSQAEE
jgi:hypothetical protein